MEADDFSAHRGTDRAPAPGRLRLVEEFLNTVSGLRDGADLIAEPDGLAAWLESRDLRSDRSVDRGDVQRAVALRDAIRALLTAPDGAPREAARVIEQAAADARLGLCLAAPDELRLVAQAGGVHGALGAIVVALHDGFADGSAKRLRVCRNPGCRWAFYDHSRNAAARWCSMNVCGSRSKAREYRRRRSTRRDVEPAS